MTHNEGYSQGVDRFLKHFIADVTSYYILAGTVGVARDITIYPNLGVAKYDPAHVQQKFGQVPFLVILA